MTVKGRKGLIHPQYPSQQRAPIFYMNPLRKNTTIFIGVDPSMRHVGLCATWSVGNRRGAYSWWEIQTKEGALDVVLDTLPARFTRWLDAKMHWVAAQDKTPVEEMRARCFICIERQYTRGLGSLYTVPVMTALLTSLVGWRRRWPHIDVEIVWPFPLQMKKFVWDAYGISAKTKKPLIEGASKKLGERVSSHVADAFFLLHLAKAVASGRFKVNYSKDSNLIIDGGPYRFNHSTGFYKKGRGK